MVMGDDNTHVNPSPDAGPQNTPATAAPRKARSRKSPGDGDSARSRGSRGKAAPVAPDMTAAAPISSPVSGATPIAPTAPAPTHRPAPRVRRGSLRSRGREPGVLRLAERARLIAEHGGVHLLADPLAALLPAARNALFNAALDDAAHAVAEGLASTLAPAVVQIWIADAAPWSAGHDRVGGLELEPSLRLRAIARAAIGGVTESGMAALQAESNAPGDLPAPKSVLAGCPAGQDITIHCWTPSPHHDSPSSTTTRMSTRTPPPGSR